MKTLKLISMIFVTTTMLLSCVSGKSMQKEIRQYRSGLFYELTSPLYHGEITDKVYLKFIDYSNLDYYTSVKRRGTSVLPLILYMYERHRFKNILGEGSLYQNYREFLTDALLTECNSSTCFNLVDEEKESPTDSSWIMEIKISRNQTKAISTLRTHYVIWFEWEYLEFTRNRIKAVETDLAIQVKITKGENTVHNKTYSRKRSQPVYSDNYIDSQELNMMCVEYMAESLSICTKELVEEIAQELHLLFTGFSIK